jgi:hypothetical protein
MNLNDIGLQLTEDNDILTARMKHQRNILLTQSDWTMHTDAPTDKEAWAVYRQALRDFPATWEPSEFADFPVSPDYVETVEPVAEELVDEPLEGEQT